MRLIKKRAFYVSFSLLGVILLLLVWPLAGWLQCGDLQAGDTDVDAVYLVCGARHQKIRVNAIVEYLRNRESVRGIQILIGRDPQKGPWNREFESNMPMYEWAGYRISKACVEYGIDDLDFVVVPGMFSGTSGEMEALGRYLKDRNNIQSLLLVSSSFHLRRCVQHLDKSLDRDVDISVVPAKSWEDRMPWTVALELGKMLRDMLGLSKMPLISREN